MTGKSKRKQAVLFWKEKGLWYHVPVGALGRVESRISSSVTLSLWSFYPFLFFPPLSLLFIQFAHQEVNISVTLLKMSLCSLLVSTV